MCTSRSFAHPLFSPALKRIPVPDPLRSHFIIAGDSSLAMVTRFGRSVTHKGTFEGALRQEMAKDPRLLGLSLRMSWSKGWDEILETVDSVLFELTYDPNGRQIIPEGIDIILAWAGNDVYGEWGYLGFTWNKQKWLKGFEELQRQAARWAPKLQAKVEEAVEKLKILASLPHVKSMAPSRESQWERLSRCRTRMAYDIAMQSHAEALAKAGVILTDRHDHFHMEATAQNLSNTTRWYLALMSGIMTANQASLGGTCSQLWQDHF